MPNEGEIIANLPFELTLAGKVYQVKKANLRQVIDWQRKIMEYSKEGDTSANLRSVAYALWLMIATVDTTITEDYILDNIAGDVQVMDVLIMLGFTNQQKVAEIPKMKDSLEKANQLAKNGGNSTQS